MVFLDCGNIDRNSAQRAARRRAPAEHRPPPRQHALRHAQPRRRRRLLHGGDRLGPDARARRRARRRAIAEALYIGLITDTGRFMYENTGPRAHRMAAELIAAGVDVQAVYRRLYEEMPLAKLDAARRWRSAQIAALRRRRADARGARAPRTSTRRRRGQLLRGDHRPAARGAGHEGRGAGARADRRPSAGASARCRCAPPTTTSTCRSIARAQGGGGHRRAAGFSTTLEPDELIAFLRGRSRAAAPGARRRHGRNARLTPASWASRRRRDGRRPADRQAGRDHLARRRRRVRRALGRRARPGTPARSTRSRPGC